MANLVWKATGEDQVVVEGLRLEIIKSKKKHKRCEKDTNKKPLTTWGQKIDNGRDISLNNVSDKLRFYI